VPGDRNLNPREHLKQCLDLLRAALDDAHRAQQERQKRFQDLDAVVAKKTEEIRAGLQAKALEAWERTSQAAPLAEEAPEVPSRDAFDAGYAIDPAELSRRISDIPEQMEIGRIGQDEKNAGARIRELRAQVRLQLMSLAVAHPEAGTALDMLDRLSPHLGFGDVDTMIRLLEATIEATAPNRRGSAGGERKQRLEKLQNRVRRLANDGLTHTAICARLDWDSILFPPGAKWPDDSWTKAMERNPNAVKKWISAARRSH